MAAKLAKERGWAINVGGGFHHCSSEKGGGFCVYADISLCIHFAFVRLNISRYIKWSFMYTLWLCTVEGHDISMKSIINFFLVGS